MLFLSRDEILQHKAMRVEAVAVPEWSGTVNVKELTGRELSLIHISEPTRPY